MSRPEMWLVAIRWANSADSRISAILEFKRILMSALAPPWPLSRDEPGIPRGGHFVH
jgi:hypothetical protein